MTTLGNSYTVPMTLEEWVQCVPWLKDDPIAEDVAKCAFVAFGDGKIAKEPREGMVRLSVPRFLDLLHDRIVPWRLEEVGFVNLYLNKNVWKLQFRLTSLVCNTEMNITSIEGECGEEIPLNITTFTDLLTLIRMLTPNTKNP